METTTGGAGLSAHLMTGLPFLGGEWPANFFSFFRFQPENEQVLWVGSQKRWVFNDNCQIVENSTRIGRDLWHLVWSNRVGLKRLFKER